MSSSLPIRPSTVLVVAAAIHDGRGRWLLQQRLPGKHHAGLWEFPGGKVDPGEEPRQALCREIGEELGVQLHPARLRPLGFADERPSSGRPSLVLLLFEGTIASGAPAALDGQSFGWFTRGEIAALPLAPLDRLLLPSLPA